MIHDANSQYFPKFLVWGCLNLDYRPNTLLLKVAGRKLGTPIPKFWESIDCWHHGSPRLLPWDDFKPYLSQFEPVVRILET